MRSVESRLLATSPARAALAAVAALLLALAPLVASAGELTGGPYTIAWDTLDAGGGTSSGGSFTIRDTIGQPEPPGPATGGAFTLVDGFWSLEIGATGLVVSSGFVLR